MTGFNPEKFFKSIPLFKEVPAAALASFAWKARRRLLAKGEFVFQEGDSAESAWWVAEGVVKIVKTAPQGRLKTLEILLRGDIFAPAGLFPMQAYPAGAVAVSKGAVVQCGRRDIEELARAVPSFSRNALTDVSLRLRRSHHLRAFDAESAETKVAAVLLWLREKAGDTLAVSRKEIAEIIGIAPETAIRVMLKLKAGGHISTAARSIKIVDPAALQALTDG